MYDLIKELIPIQTFLKIRNESEFLIVIDKNLNLQYLNEVAKDFYLKIDGNKKIAEIISEVKEIYDVSKEELEHDILLLIRDLQWQGLIKMREA